MKKFCALLAFLIIVGIFIPAASAAYIEIPVTEISHVSNNYDVNGTPSSNFSSAPVAISGLVVDDVQILTELPTIILFGEFDTNNESKYANSVPIRLTRYNTYSPSYGSGTLSYHLYPAKSGELREGYVVLEINSFTKPATNDYRYDILEEGTNTKAYIAADHLRYNETRALNPDDNFPVGLGQNDKIFFGQYTLNIRHSFYNLIRVTGPDVPSVMESDIITISKYDDDGRISNSRVIISNNYGIYSDELQPSQNNVSVSISSLDRPYNIDIYDPYVSRWHNQTVFASPDDAPKSSKVTVYVRNAQNHALLADAHIDISANVNGNFYEVVNKTVPSGIYSIELQPTGGGMPNPDFYRLITTVEGYNSIMPYIDFEAIGETSIYAYLEPIGGAPEDENKTFIDFYVRDLAGNAISGATVNFGGYTLITNSAGYTIFTVEKSKTYTWVVSKSGYGSLTGNVVIGADPRHTINTVLAPSVTPTPQTPIPTSTAIGPAPTMTAPTGEPASNWLEWFAAHFGMILGGGVEIGKIFMWLCFAVPVGVYVGKEAKAGAAGFMAGAGIVTLFFVLIGWVPIWLLVLLALIIGLLYAKVFNTQDNGGGR